MFLAEDCTQFRHVMHGDSYNPCMPSSVNENSIECKEWQNKYPKEYKKYKERMKQSIKSN